MFPPNSVIKAADRWLHLLLHSTSKQAFVLLQSNKNYTDLTQTQYALAVEWLSTVDLVVVQEDGIHLSPDVRTLPYTQLNQLLFERSIQHASPAWLPDADKLIPDPSELPQDAADVAATLNLSNEIALLAINSIRGRIDLENRARIGRAGETELIELLESQWPGATTHVALQSDGFGYDIVLRHNSIPWHIEVKSTTRRGRLLIYISRHEHEVGLRHPNWRLVVVGLNEQLSLGALATVNYSSIASRAPKDVSHLGQWQSVSHEIELGDLSPGLPFLTPSGSDSSWISAGVNDDAHSIPAFGWMPAEELHGNEKLT